MGHHESGSVYKQLHLLTMSHPFLDKVPSIGHTHSSVAILSILWHSLIQSIPHSLKHLPCVVTVFTVYSITFPLQWNLSNPDTNGAGESVIVSEVSSFQRLQEWYIYIRVGKVSWRGVLIPGVWNKKPLVTKCNPLSLRTSYN